MPQRVFVGSFATEEDILGAARAAREHGFHITDAYTPYPVHGLDQAMGLRPSRLPWACFTFGLIGAAFAITSQPWAMAYSWPMNVGGKPWNSMPAYIPVTFEVMVLLGGLGLVLTFLLRCRLLPGKEPAPHFRSATDNRFILVLDRTGEAFDPALAEQLCRVFHAVRAEEHEE
jgi:Protein of unknown function (DUF3341)